MYKIEELKKELYEKEEEVRKQMRKKRSMEEDIKYKTFRSLCTQKDEELLEKQIVNIQMLREEVGNIRHKLITLRSH